MPLLPEGEQDKIHRFVHKADADASLCGKVLLAEALQSFGRSKTLLNDIEYTEHKRPYINSIGADFNITHSKTMVGLAYAEQGKVGIDIEYMQQIEEFQFKQFFCQEELSWIGTSIERFYTLWTRKEAIIKASGKGVFHELTSINVLEDACEVDGVKYWLHELQLDEKMKSALATTHQDQSFEIKKIDINAIALGAS